MTKSLNSKKGFTLLEILLVVGIIAILAGIVILAINPTKQLGDARNAQRRSDVLTIINGIYQYAIDEGHSVADLDIASSTGSDCTSEGVAAANTSDADGLYTLLVGTSSAYMTNIPRDPTSESDGGTAADKPTLYYAHLNSDTNRVTVCAPSAYTDNNAVISVTR